MTVVFHHELKDELRGLVFCSTTVPFGQVNKYTHYHLIFDECFDGN